MKHSIALLSLGINQNLLCVFGEITFSGYNSSGQVDVGLRHSILGVRTAQGNATRDSRLQKTSRVKLLICCVSSDPCNMTQQRAEVARGQADSCCIR